MPKSKDDQPAKPAHSYALIGETLPASITVLDTDGKPRTLLSYKSPTEVLVVGFFSPSCEANQQAWRRLKRIYESYKEWRVAFVGISVQSGEDTAELAEAMKKAGLSYTVARDEGQKAAHALNITALPQILITDEWGQLRYRGPVNESDKALENIISHQDPVADPEPAIEGCALQ